MNTTCPHCHGNAPAPSRPNLLECPCGLTEITNAALADLHATHPTNQDLATRIRGRVWEQLSEDNPAAWDALTALDDLNLFATVLRGLPNPA